MWYTQVDYKVDELTFIGKLLLANIMIMLAARRGETPMVDKSHVWFPFSDATYKTDELYNLYFAIPSVTINEILCDHLFTYTSMTLV